MTRRRARLSCLSFTPTLRSGSRASGTGMDSGADSGCGDRRDPLAGFIAWTMALVATALLFLTSASSAHAFGTINSSDPHGEHAEHERITRLALGCGTDQTSDGNCFESKRLRELAGTDHAFGAVGKPDLTEFYKSAAHCDDADFLDVPGYPKTRLEATRELIKCLSHLRAKFAAAWRAADELVSKSDPPALVTSNTEVVRGNPIPVASCVVRGGCKVIDQFGRALHGAQDFHSHSNWNDVPAPGQKVSVDDPPGLGMVGDAPFFDLRWNNSPRVPRDLTTGCFSLTSKIPVVGKSIEKHLNCRGRVLHATLNKDKGIINVGKGLVEAAFTPRGKLHGGLNFARAVEGAVAETKRQWADLRNEILARYPKRGALMVCAMTRNDPTTECQGLSVAIVIDSSGSNEWTDPSDLRIAAGEAFNSSLVTQGEVDRNGQGAADKSAVISFSSSASVLSPLGDPASASFAGIGAEGGTCIACGVEAGHALLASGAQGPPPFDKSGIVVLTDGEDEDVSAIISAINRAAAAGIRTSIGFLNPPPPTTFLRAAARPAALLEEEEEEFHPDPGLVAAVQGSGGVAATIASAEAQRSFVDVAVTNGLTAVNDPNGNDDGGTLAAGVEVSGRIDPPGDIDTWAYVIPRRQVASISLTGPGTSVTVRDARGGRLIGRGDAGSSDAATVTVGGARKRRLEITVSAGPGQAAEYQLGVTPTGTATGPIPSKPTNRRACAKAKAAKRAAQKALARARRHHQRSVRRKAAKVRRLKRRVRRLCH